MIELELQTMTMENRQIKTVVRQIKEEYPEDCWLNEPLAPHTSYQVGGPADAFFKPTSIDDLEQVVRLCLHHKVPFYVLGKGANILVHDDGFRGVVITLERCCHQLFHEGNLLYVGSGCTVQELVEYCENHGLAGLDYLSGIPGTVGGALRMNAGAFVGEIGDRVLRIDALNEKGQRVQIHNEEAQFGYRRADGLVNKILLGCWLIVEPGDPRRLKEAREDYLRRRAEKQPLEYPSCGSVFKRPPGDYAGRLIEAAGCKGLRVGGAMVSPKHANFIVNVENATARDIYELIVLVQEKVYQQFQVWLELEVKLVGFPESDCKRVEKPDYV
ncbi:MAG: UDP-N-acetylmuramate dehydrogenase [Calditrichaeota bacterium]|nr:MAG: UDP-N-acetylmuramate dehydrogenase [Calditrichota bacterium]